ncbi:MAG TPA: rod shape-determining protein MreD [Dehalococcoidia bacterium]|nr:rod shape-determining protein MreD [Dehalococcoidia bacterium]
MKYFVAGVIAWLLAILDVAAMPYVQPLGVSPDLVLIFAVIWAVTRGEDEGLVIVPLIGLIQDLTTSDPIGTSVLGLAPAVPIALAVRMRALESQFLPTIAAVMATSACYGVISTSVLWATGQEIAVFHTLFRVIVPSIIINALFTPIIYMPMSWFAPRQTAWLRSSARLPSTL